MKHKIYVVNKRDNIDYAKKYPGATVFYIGRGSPLGNMYSHLPNTKAKHSVATRHQAVACFEKDLNAAIKAPPSQREKEQTLMVNMLNQIYVALIKGDVVLECFCSPQKCHGDVIKAVIIKACERMGRHYGPVHTS